MERIFNKNHNKYTFIYACSKLFERASYYGLRSLIVLYMMGESLKLSREEVFRIYGLFTGSIVFSQILGAILGDFIIGNKKSIVIGGILQAIGAVCFCIPTTTGLYIGIVLVVLGGGFYTPNMIAHFGKLYLNKTKLLDAGFTIFYFAVNIGAIIGPLLIGLLVESIGWNIGFIAAGILMLVSISFPLLTKEWNHIQTNEKYALSSGKVIKILFAFVLVGLFWAIYEITNMGISDIQMKLNEYLELNVPKSLWNSMSTAFFIPVSVIAIILWSFFYTNQFIKLAIGFLFGAISFGILFVIPQVSSNQHVVLYLISMLFLSISEIHIAPIIHSIITQYSNPKYLAIIISLAYVPIKMFSVIVGFFNSELSQNPSLSLKLGMIAMFVISIGLIIRCIIALLGDRKMF